MAKKIKNQENPEAEISSENKRPRRAGKDIVPRLRVIDQVSYITMASGRGKKSLTTHLLWAPKPKPENAEQPFLFLFELPDGEGGTMIISVLMGTAQAQAVYAGHPRRVPKHDMPPECPLEEVIDPVRKTKKAKTEEEK